MIPDYIRLLVDLAKRARGCRPECRLEHQTASLADFTVNALSTIFVRAWKYASSFLRRESAANLYLMLGSKGVICAAR